jgi:hypothetical protein
MIALGPPRLWICGQRITEERCPQLHRRISKRRRSIDGLMV